MPRFSQHETIELLLESNQFEACRVVVETMTRQVMDACRSDENSTDQLAFADALKRWQQRDLELACLHIYHCKALVGLNRYEEAAQKADIAVFLAEKVKDQVLLEEALYRGGTALGRHGDFRGGIDRFTRSLASGAQTYRGEALYSRALCYYGQGAYSSAISDYEDALRALGNSPQLARMGRLNLAWVLILAKEFSRAETLLADLAAESGAEADRTLQLQLAHDWTHLEYLRGEHGSAIKRAVAALREAGKEHTHIRAYIALTLMLMAADHDLPQSAFTLGLTTKRLAGKARRPDIDESASRRMRGLEYQNGSEPLTAALQKLRQVLPGALARRTATKSNDPVGGVS